MWRDALLVAGKDLRIELRSRVALWQVLPVAVLSLVLYAFALGPVRQTLASAAPGLFWLAVLFSTVLATQRSFAIESGDGTRDGLRVSGIDPAGVFLGKAAAVAAELAVLQLVLWAAMTLLFGVHLRTPWLAVVASFLATIGLATAGTLYGALSAGLRVRETLLPLLVLPVLAPVLLAASRAWSGALSGSVSAGVSWLRILGPFAAVYLVIGIVLYGPLLETG
jgi:heme exporter protein B